MPLRLTSSAFANGQPIPREYTCEGEDTSPPLEWDGLPAGTRSLVLIVDDPDAPDPAAPKLTWVHWVLYNLPPRPGSIPRAVPPEELPPETRDGLNDWQRSGYGGPCPPIGRHRYFHKLYALDVQLPDLGTPTKVLVERAMAGHILESTELMGTYQRG